MRIPWLPRKFLRIQFQIVLVLVALLIGLRVALPYLVKTYVNKTLDEMPDYDGSIGDVDIKLWRGAYQIQDVNIVKTSGDVPVPFFASRNIEFSIEWKALFDGSLVGEIEFYAPVINIVNGRSDDTTQVGVDKPWLDVIKKLFPLDINRFAVHDGSLHYRDFFSHPKVDMEIDHIQVLGTNLTNSKDLSKTLVAKLDMQGRAFQESNLNLHMDLDPSTDKPTFNLDMKMEAVPLVKINDFAEAYGGFDFEKGGTMTVVAELAAADGKLKGYVKPLFDNVRIVNLKQDIKNPLALVWEGLVGGVTRLFRNQPHNRFATKIPISGSFDNPQIAVLPTLGNILKNEFVRVYQGDFENSITLEDAADKKSEAKQEAEKSRPPEQKEPPRGNPAKP